MWIRVVQKGGIWSSFINYGIGSGGIIFDEKTYTKSHYKLRHFSNSWLVNIGFTKTNSLSV